MTFSLRKRGPMSMLALAIWILVGIIVIPVALPVLRIVLGFRPHAATGSSRYSCSRPAVRLG